MDLIKDLIQNLTSSYNLGPEEVLDLVLRACRKLAGKNHYSFEHQSGFALEFFDRTGARIDLGTLAPSLVNTVHELLRQTARERSSRWPVGVQQVRVLREEREFLAVESLDGKLYGVVPERLRNAQHPASGQAILVMSNGSHVLSQTDTRIVKHVFAREVPEVAAGVVEIARIARMPGVRSKVAVRSRAPHVNAVGACVGQRAERISAIRHGLDGEAVDVVFFDDDMHNFVGAAFAPVRIEQVSLSQGTAHIYVDPIDVTRVIGRQGDNARLVAMLTGLKIDVRSSERAAS